MITHLLIDSFKTLEHVDLELGNINVFIGANGSGKSNLLEAVGVLAAAADGKVKDQRLLERGVRPGVPMLYKSAFPTTKAASHIYFSARTRDAHYAVSLNNPLSDPRPAWRYKTEQLERGNEKLVGRGPNLRNNPNTEDGLAALKAADLKPGDPALRLLRRLQSYVIYTPTTSVLRGVANETQPARPLGLSGGHLPDAVHRLLSLNDDASANICAGALDLISWAEGYGSAPATSMPLSPAAAASPHVIRFTDRYMKKGRNTLSGYDASEGALYVLFLAVLAGHPDAPRFCAVDNADHGLNPGLVSALFGRFVHWVLGVDTERQILLTSHNPAVLDALPLQDDRVRLFTVDRDNTGRSVFRRVMVDERLREMADKGWTLSRLWMNKHLGGMPNV